MELENNKSTAPQQQTENPGPILDLQFLSRNFRKILLVVILGMSYIQLRYECESHLVNIARLKREINEVRYTGIATWGDLTQENRPENIIRRVSQNDIKLIKSDEPPVIIK